MSISYPLSITAGVKIINILHIIREFSSIRFGLKNEFAGQTGYFAPCHHLSFARLKKEKNHKAYKYTGAIHKHHVPLVFKSS